MHAGNPWYRSAISHISHSMMARGADAARATYEAHAILYAQLQRQSMMLSFVDNFRLMSIICILVLPLMFVMKKK
jgi:MFS transporter, DHA2 family, multidrug resistance protein